MKLALPEDLRHQILAAARAAFPRECCGLILGVRALGAQDGIDAHALALHPARNLATHSDRFEMDPVDQFAALRMARATGQAVIGCYHSHPNGLAWPSLRDLAGAGEEGFLWLIVGKAEMKLFVYWTGAFTEADLVTSSS
jgi:proteasome lid subunit RPN8/RPN11